MDVQNLTYQSVSKPKAEKKKWPLDEKSESEVALIWHNLWTNKITRTIWPRETASFSRPAAGDLSKAVIDYLIQLTHFLEKRGRAEKIFKGKKNANG